MEDLYVPNAGDWRRWLAENHESSEGVWLVFYKKHTGTPSIEYRASLEEALCYGWVDSLIKKIDEDRYKRKFTPRREESKWSELNKKLVAKLIAEGRMTPIGMALVDAAKVSGEWDRSEPSTPEIPSELLDALETNGQARAAFEALAPSHRKTYIRWIADGKREDTRRRRSAEAIGMLERGERLGI